MIVNILIGFALVVALTFLGRTQFSWLNGLIPLFPTFALIGQISAYLGKGEAAAKDVAVIGLFSLIPYAAYLLAVFYGSDIIGFPKAAALGLLLWCIIAGSIVFLKMTVFKA